jgi:hypothetical protein
MVCSNNAVARAQQAARIYLEPSNNHRFTSQCDLSGDIQLSTAMRRHIAAQRVEDAHLEVKIFDIILSQAHHEGLELSLAGGAAMPVSSHTHGELSAPAQRTASRTH